MSDSENLQQVLLWLKKNKFKSSRLRCSVKYLFQKNDSFQEILLLHCPFMMKQQASICLFIKIVFHESNSAVLKNLQMLQFYKKNSKRPPLKCRLTRHEPRAIDGYLSYIWISNFYSAYVTSQHFGTRVNVNRKLALLMLIAKVICNTESNEGLLWNFEKLIIQLKDFSWKVV